MLKKIIISAATLLLSTNLFAQSSFEIPVGYTNITELGFNKAAFDHSKTYSFSLHTINGMHFNQHFFAGIGVGYERGEGGGNNLPVFADARYFFGENKIKPFVNQNIGYMFHIFAQEYVETFDTKGMYSANTSDGLAIPVKFAQSLNFSLGYRLMYLNKIKFTFEERSFTYHLMTLKAGLTF